jgi:hypothetical protein
MKEGAERAGLIDSVDAIVNVACSRERRTAMKFVLVNDRAARGSTCATCSGSIGFGYLREISSQRLYCDHACYCGRKARSVPIGSRADTGVDGLPVRSAGGFQPGDPGMIGYAALESPAPFAW